MARIEEWTEVKAPIETCYRTLIDINQYPLFVINLNSIRHKGDPNVWHWELRGPEGRLLKWEAHMQAMKHQHHIISWHTVRQADVINSGAITLKELGDNRTRLDLTLEFTPTESLLNEFGEHAMQRTTKAGIRDSLALFKKVVEGHMVAPQPTVSRRGEIGPDDDLPYSI